MKALQKARLEQVRSELLQGRSHQTVSRVATRWGITHLGRFAQVYKKEYGESPSETLRQSRQRSTHGGLGALSALHQKAS